MAEASAELIPASQPDRWDAALAEVEHDIYHSSAYHLCAQSTEGGSPYLFAFRGQHGEVAAVPFVVRPVDEVQGLEGEGYVDARSVDGYPGSVCSPLADAEDREAFRKAYQNSFRRSLEELGVITFFGRQNPFLRTEWMLDGLADVQRLGSTVGVDCTLAEAAHEAQMTSHHRRNLRKVRRSGLQVRHDTQLSRLDDFIEIYRQTMDRVGAAPTYYFSTAYFHQLAGRLGDGLRLVVAELDGELVTGALFLGRGPVVHYHLGATSAPFRRLGASHLLFDAVRRWCGETGRRWLHLGGGVGASEDSLFRFKAGFSEARFPYHVCRLILDHQATDHLLSQRNSRLGEQRLAPSSPFFPPYRAPADQPDD